MTKMKTNKLTLGAILAIMVISITLALSTFAFAQTATVSQDPDPEPVPTVEKGCIQINAQRFDLGEISYKLGDSGNYVQMDSQSKKLMPDELTNVPYIYLKVEPGNNLINKEYTKVSDGSQWLDVNYNELVGGTYKLIYNPDSNNGQCADLGIVETRLITITLTDASKKMIEDNFTMIAGHGDKNDVKIKTPSTSNTIYVDKGTEETLILSFAIRENKYFIPNITVNDVVYPTVDTGMVDEDEHLIICSTLRDSAAAKTEFQVDLSVFAEAATTKDSEKIEEVIAKYEVMKEGKVINPGTYELGASDTDIDSNVNDAIATFDLTLTKDSSEAHEITDGMEVHLLLDASTFTDENYKVVRNHDGQIEALDTMCEVVRNPGTGEVKGLDVAFNSDKFSDYSIVPANWSPAVPEESTTAQTGDELPIMPLFAIAGIALCFVLFSNRKSKIIRK